MTRGENYFSLLLMTEPLYQWNGYESPVEPFAWSTQCKTRGVCEVTPENYYKILYLKIVNGWPSIFTDLLNHNLDTPFNTALHRTWVREHQNDPAVSSYWIQEETTICKSGHYFGSLSFANSYNKLHFKLQNGQEIRFLNLVHCVMVSSGKDSAVIYHNISDSWVDVSLWLHLDGYWTTPPPESHWVPPRESFLGYTWRVHGASPDPWDAPEHIKNKYPSWPVSVDSDSSYVYLQTCYHLSSNPYGSIQYENINNIEDVYRETVPIETHIMPVKGAWSGYIYTEESYNEFVYDTVSTQFKKIRIEKFEDYHRFYITYGEGAPDDLTGFVIDMITDQDKWDSKIYGITFDLLADGTINIVIQESNYVFPTDTNDYILYDTELVINKLSPKAVIPTNIYNLLTPVGIDELTRIYNEATADWITDGWDSENISIKQQSSLVRKQRILE